MRVRAIIGIAAALCALLLLALPAFAYDEPHDQPRKLPDGSTNHGMIGQGCGVCHRGDVAGPDAICISCHPGYGGTGLPTPAEGKGPHGVYSAGSDRCDACHTVHVATGSQLLPGATVTAACYSCHDGSGGRGVYGTIRARGLSEAASHSIDATNVVPGGNAGTGGSATMGFSGPGGTLGCDDCHSPHDAQTVAPFTTERRRTDADVAYGDGVKTNRLLKQHPGGVPTATPVYGSDWCLACHQGRSSAGAVHNHPVESLVKRLDASSYETVTILNADTPTSVTVTGTMARTNRGYLMPMPRTAGQSGHLPICQQCHEDSRNVGTLSSDGLTGDAGAYSVTATDGNAPGDNPRFQNFPHETVNSRMTVETNDDLCMNCHPPTMLP